MTLIRRLFIARGHGQCQGRLKDIHSRQNLRAIAVSHDSQSLAVSSSSSSIQIWDIDSQRIRRVFGRHSESVSALCFSPDDKRLISGCGASSSWKPVHREIKLWDIQKNDGAQIHSVGFQFEIQAAVLSPTEPVLAIAGRESHRTPVVVRLWDPIKRQKIGDIEGSGESQITCVQSRRDSACGRLF